MMLRLQVINDFTSLSKFFYFLKYGLMMNFIILHTFLNLKNISINDAYLLINAKMCYNVLIER